MGDDEGCITLSLTKLNMFSAPTKTITIGSSSLRDTHIKIRRLLEWEEEGTHQGTIVILNPTRAQTLSDVMVLTAISTKAVKVTPSRECTASIRRKDQAT